MLVRIPGTPLENANTVEPLEFVRTIAVARIMLPKSMLKTFCGPPFDVRRNAGSMLFGGCELNFRWRSSLDDGQRGNGC